MTSWAGRIPGGLAPEAWEFLHSLPHDRFLWADDCRGTIGHVRGLEAAGVLSGTDAQRLVDALEDIEDRPELVDDADEDVHSAIERVLTERLGDLGRNVHAGRSRNDQVATAMRLWARRELAALRVGLGECIVSLADRAEETCEMRAPGYTHLQRAQPITVGHWLAAHGFALVRDAERVAAAARTTDVSPLGAGALAGSTLGIDPRVSADALGFGSAFENSLDAVADRDFLCDAAYACSMVAMHLSRLAEDVVLWSSAEFGFIRLPDAYATGSSMMPQKKNPDVAEVARGRAAVATGALTGLLGMLKSLGLAYYRELQTDKELISGLLPATRQTLAAMRGLIAGIDFDEERLARAASSDLLLATDLAEALVREGLPFRRAHEVVGGLVRTASDDDITLTEAVERHSDALAPLSASAAHAVLDPATGVDRRQVLGGPAPDSVRTQARTLRDRVAEIEA